MLRLIVLAASLALAACGFEPLYGGAAGQRTVQDLAGVRIGEIADRSGQELRNALVDRFGTDVPTTVVRRYRLDVTVPPTALIAGPGVRGADVVQPLNVSATVLLVDIASGARVHQFVVTASASVVLVDNPFASTQNTRGTRTALSRVLADQIADRVAAYLRSRPAA
jgi:LPS-assembly lipoprotein